MAENAKMADFDFTDSALIGQVVSVSLLTKLMEKGVISPADVADVLDDALLRLEEWQANFPDHQPYFEIARATLSELVDAVRPTTKKRRE
jgi:hypothetical protein